MGHITTISQLQSAGVAVQPHEAVALVQELIQNPSCEPPEAPFGPPSLENVRLEADGSVSCRACDSTPAVSEIAILLQRLLPQGASHVPGGLRYAIARALLEVDAPPFDSLNEFSAVLGRFERGEREQVLRDLFRRFRTAGSPALALTAVGSPADRRQHTTSVTELRRELRRADERLYSRERATDAALPAGAVLITAPRPAARRDGAIAAGLAAGLALVACGEIMHLGWRVPSALLRGAGTAVVQTAAPVAREAVRAPQPPIDEGPRIAPPPKAATTPAASVPRLSPVSTPSGVVKAVRAPDASASEDVRKRQTPRVNRGARPTQTQGRSRSRFQWLKNVFRTDVSRAGQPNSQVSRVASVHRSF